MLRTERQSARMSKIKNGGLDQYAAEPFEQQQFKTFGVEGVKSVCQRANCWIFHRRSQPGCQLETKSTVLTREPALLAADVR